MTDLPFLFAASQSSKRFSTRNRTSSQNPSFEYSFPLEEGGFLSNSPPTSPFSTMYDHDHIMHDEEEFTGHMNPELFEKERKKWDKWFEAYTPIPKIQIPEQFFENIAPNISISKIYYYSILIEIFLSHRNSYACMDSFLKALHLIVKDCTLPVSFKTIISQLNSIGIHIHEFDYCSHCCKFVFIDDIEHCPLCEHTSKEKLYYIQNSDYLNLLSMYDPSFFSYCQYRPTENEGEYVSELAQHFRDAEEYVFYCDAQIDELDLHKSGKKSIWPLASRWRNIPYEKSKLPGFNFITTLISLPSPCVNDACFIPYIMESNYRCMHPFSVYIPSEKHEVSLLWVHCLLLCDGEQSNLILDMKNHSSYAFCRICERNAENYVNPNNIRSQKRVMKWIDEPATIRSNFIQPNAQLGVP